VLQSPSPKTPPTVKTEAEKFVPVRFTGPLASDEIPLVRVAEPLTTIGSAWALEMAASRKVTTASTRTNLVKESCRDVYITNNHLIGMTLEETKGWNARRKHVTRPRWSRSTPFVDSTRQTNYRHLTTTN
jgi:hypothetical protein